jgi:hypothetical protein
MNFLRSPAFPQQDEVYERMIYKKYFALYSDLGTGKSYMLLREFLVMWMTGVVDGLLIIGPVDAHRQWIERELPATSDQECVTASWPEEPPMERTSLPRIFTIYPEAFRRKQIPPPRAPGESIANLKARRKLWRAKQRNALKKLEKFLQSGRIGCIVDESQMMMHVKSNTAKTLRSLRDHAVYLRIASGYPAPGGRLELYYPQYTWLSPNILKCGTFSDFKIRYCETGGFKGKSIEGYINEDDFKERIAPYTYTVEIEDCMKMPERTWLEFDVELTPQQAKIIKQIRDEFMVELKKKTLFMPMVLQRLTRIQQAACGFLPYELDEDAEGNPEIRLEWIPELRTKALENVLERTRGKVIVWSRFSPCTERLVKHFNNPKMIKRFGGYALKYRGGMTREERADSKERFIKDPKAKIIFAQPKSAGTGTDGFQHACRFMYYWNNSYDSQHRRQTERRVWRLGQSKAVVYGDFIAQGTYDSRIRTVLMQGQRMADNLHRELAAWKQEE